MATKSIHKPEYKLLTELLLQIRKEANLKQGHLVPLLARPQSFFSDVEHSSRRMDLVQLRDYCLACGVDLVTFVTRFEKMIADGADHSSL